MQRKRQRGSTLEDAGDAWKFRYREYFIDEHGKWRSRQPTKYLYKSEFPTEEMAKQGAAELLRGVNDKANKEMGTSVPHLRVGTTLALRSEILAPLGDKWQPQGRQAGAEGRQPIDIPEGKWRTCRKVTLRKGELYCELDPTRIYSLAEAYKRRPHSLFVDADSDLELIDFIQTWGPLYLTEKMVGPGGVVANSLDYCRESQSEMRAVLDVITAFKLGNNEREALVRLIKVEAELYKDDKDDGRALKFIGDCIGASGNVLDWAETANLAGIREAMDHLVSQCISVSCTLRLSCEPRGERHVYTGWELLTLEDALWWMIWSDEFPRHPIV